MIQITDDAQDYFRKLIEQQDADGMHLRIRVIAPGTPHAECDLQFCPTGRERDTDTRLAFDGFDLFVAEDSATWLEAAEIDFERSGAGGQLSIRAPGIKGERPEEDAPLEDRVSWVVESEINPMLASHGGRVALVEITDATEVVLQFGGGCQGCGMADVTLKQGVEKTLKGHFPEITAVLDATDHQSGNNPYYAPRD